MYPSPERNEFFFVKILVAYFKTASAALLDVRIKFIAIDKAASDGKGVYLSQWNASPDN